jgi:hypothetical protein
LFKHVDSEHAVHADQSASAPIDKIYKFNAEYTKTILLHKLLRKQYTRQESDIFIKYLVLIICLNQEYGWNYENINQMNENFENIHTLYKTN